MRLLKGELGQAGRPSRAKEDVPQVTEDALREKEDGASEAHLEVAGVQSWH